MKLLDRYLVKQLLFPILFCSATLIFLVFMADIFDYLDEMIKHKTGIQHILIYYLLLIPETFVSTIPWASLLGTTYVLTYFNYHNEITAMKVAGLEITSIIRPVIFAGFALGIISFIVSDQIVPFTSKRAANILNERIEQKKTKEKREIFDNVTYYGGKDRLYYTRTFNAKEEKMEDFIILWLDSHRNVKKKTVAREARWNGTQWELRQATDYSLEAKGDMLGEPAFQKIAIYPEVNEPPQEFLKAINEGVLISYGDLKDYVTKLKENGVKLSTEIVALQQKLAFPWHSLVVMFLTIPFLAKTSTRRMIAINVLSCLLFVFLFHVLGAVMLALGKAGKIFPIVSVWTPNFLFGFGTFFFLDRANQ
ncbi:MAG: LptF/LptG family permease [Candidatus Omnitrophica bacterium]|nr:LptF/LptG family permease [Candidatus Omnitrophota bacterium]